MSENVPSAPRELDLVQVLESILASRKWAVIALLIVSALFWTAQTLLNLALPPVHSYTARIDLVFNGVERRQYPNGNPFDINDIIAPVILNRVFGQNNLAVWMKREDFLTSFSVSPYTPDRSIIIAKYETQVRNLKQAEIESIREGLKRELDSASSAGVEIQFSSSKASTISEEVAIKILRDVPSEWARYQIEDLGVMQHDVSLYTDRVINVQLLDELDYLIAFEMLVERVRLLESNLTALSNLPNGKLVRDTESGYSVPDLQEAVSDVEQYQIVPLMNPIRALGIAKDEEAVRLYFNNLVDDMGRKRELANSLKGNVEETYDTYLKYEKSAVLQAERTPTGGSMIPQFGAEFLDRIVEMTNAGDDIDYRQELNQRQLMLADEIAEWTARIDRIETLLDAIKSGNDSSYSAELRERYTANVSKRVPSILEDLRKYFAITGRIYDKLSFQQLGNGGRLFNVSDGETDHATANHILSYSNLRLYLIICFLTLMISIPASMIRSALRRT